MEEILAGLKAEKAYFGTICGQRGGYIVVNMDESSEMVSKGEPLFLWLQAEVDPILVMTPEDLMKAGLEEIVKKWA